MPYIKAHTGHKSPHPFRRFSLHILPEHPKLRALFFAVCSLITVSVMMGFSDLVVGDIKYGLSIPLVELGLDSAPTFLATVPWVAICLLVLSAIFAAYFTLQALQSLSVATRSLGQPALDKPITALLILAAVSAGMAFFTPIENTISTNGNLETFRTFEEFVDDQLVVGVVEQVTEDTIQVRDTTGQIFELDNTDNKAVIGDQIVVHLETPKSEIIAQNRDESDQNDNATTEEEQKNTPIRITPKPDRPVVINPEIPSQPKPPEPPAAPPSQPKLPDAPSVAVTVRARGTSGAEKIELRIKNKKVKTYTLSTSQKSYTHTHSSSVFDTDVTVAFINDASGRDVIVDFIIVNGTTLQTEAPSVYSTGTFDSATRCAPGNKRSETLHCGGYLQYSIGGAGLINGDKNPTTPTPTPAPTPTPTPSPTPTPTPAPAPTPTPSPSPTSKAGHSGAVGCVSNCQTVGFQNLDGKSNFVLENKIISNPNGKCLSIKNARNITIRNVTVRNCATNTTLSGAGYHNPIIDISGSSSVTITNSLFDNNASKNSIGSRNNLINVNETPNFTFRNNHIKKVNSDISQKSGDKGNRAIVITGNSSKNSKIERNTFYDAGRNALQIIRVRGATGMSFSYNRVEGRSAWNSDYEDMVNFYSSTGTSSSPIIVKGNYFRNGGPSKTGTGIIVGDGNTSSGPSEWINVDDNVFVDPGHVGINVAGGNNFNVRNNVVYGGSSKVVHSTTVGFAVNDYGYSAECKNHTISGNRVFMKNPLVGSGVNHAWIPGTCTNNVKITNNTWGDSSLGYGVWDI